MLDQKITVFFITPYADSFDEALQKLQADSDIEVVESSDVLEVVTQAKQVEKAIIVLHCSKFPHYIKNVTLLKLLKDEIRNESVKVVSTLSIDDLAVVSKLAYHGCLDVLKEPVTGKSLLFKVQRQISNLQNGNSDFEDQKKPVQKAGKQASDSLFEFEEPLGLESDFWRLTRDSPKQVGKKWMVVLEGPRPSKGEWSPLEGGVDKWKWCPPGPEQEQNSGYWAFFGQKPRFTSGTWWFVGPSARLSFFEDGVEVGVRISVKGKKLHVTKDTDLESINRRSASHSTEAEISTEISETTEIDSETEIDKEIERNSEQTHAATIEYKPTSEPPPAPQPKLHPLQLGILMSELMTQKELTLEQMSQRFCQYVSQSFGGGRAELWVNHNSQWICASTWDGTDPEYQKSILAWASANSAVGVHHGVFIGSVIDRDSEDPPIGALAVGGFQFDDKCADFAWAYSSIVRGLVKSLMSKGVQVSEPQAA